MNSNDKKTIRHFGSQFVLFKKTHHSGYYNSKNHLLDMFGPIMVDVKGKNIADIGSGPGRVIEMLLELKAKHVTGIEPSDAIKLIKKTSKITLIQDVGEKLPVRKKFDYIFCLGVLHHIENPKPVLVNALKALKPGGRILCWFYAHEGNEIYVKFVNLLRKITIYLPDKLLMIIAKFFTLTLTFYAHLPYSLLFKRDYFKNIFLKYNFTQRTLIIFDQLNPQNAKYYKKSEIEDLFISSGYKSILFYNNSNYSWSVSAQKV